MKKPLLFAVLITLCTMLMSFSSMEKKPSLKEAVDTQNAEKVKELLAAGADPNEKISSQPVLFWATAWSNCEIMKLLLDAGADVNAIGGAGKESALCALAEAFEPDSALKRNIASNVGLLKRVKGDTAKVAKWMAHTDITRFSTVYDRAKLLLSYGADPNIVTVFNSPFLGSLVKMQKPAVRAMMESGKVNLNQCYPAIDLDLNKATKGWKVVPEQMTPLMFAVGANDLELVKMFVEAGADVDQTKPFKDKFATAINIAAINGYQEILEYLVPHSKTAMDIVKGLPTGNYCVAFIMEQVSSGLGTRSVNYACRYIQVELTKEATETEITTAARNYIANRYAGSDNGYKEKEVFFFKKACNDDCKKEMNARYAVSENFMVDYMKY